MVVDSTIMELGSAGVSDSYIGRSATFDGGWLQASILPRTATKPLLSLAAFRNENAGRNPSLTHPLWSISP